MQVKHHRPVARGVSQLMYVGDVAEPTEAPWWAKVAVAALALWLVTRK